MGGNIVMKKKGPVTSKPRITDEKILELLKTKSVCWIAKNYFVGKERIKQVYRGER
jgi:hypothetical protein